jgi:hypothetical protein
VLPAERGAMTISIKQSKGQKSDKVKVQNGALPFATVCGARSKQAEGATFYPNPRTYGKTLKDKSDSDDDKEDGKKGR